MQTSPQRKSKARTLTADSPLPYPDSANYFASEKPECWLVWWFREQTQVEALKKLCGTGYDSPKFDALRNAARLSQAEANKSLEYLVATGGLLFAWAGTTALAQGGAA